MAGVMSISFTGSNYSRKSPRMKSTRSPTSARTVRFSSQVVSTAPANPVIVKAMNALGTVTAVTRRLRCWSSVRTQAAALVARSSRQLTRTLSSFAARW